MRVTLKPLSGVAGAASSPKKYIAHSFLPASLAKKSEQSVNCTGLALKVTPMGCCSQVFVRRKQKKRQLLSTQNPSLTILREGPK